jgi:hypothetical protein
MAGFMAGPQRFTRQFSGDGGGKQDDAWGEKVPRAKKQMGSPNRRMRAHVPPRGRAGIICQDAQLLASQEKEGAPGF